MPKTRVLLVEDDADIRETVCEVLEELGFSVDAQHNGKTALDWLLSSESNLPDVIVLDLLMPVMNGRAFLAALRKEPRLAKLPVVVSTAARLLDESKPLPVGRAAVRKPYEIDELLQAIETVIAAPPSEGDPSGIFAVDDNRLE